MRTRILLRLVLVVLPTMGLMLLWLAFLPRQGQAAPVATAKAASAARSPAAQASSTQAPAPAATPDPRWLEIVRARSSAAEAAPLAGGMSINLNLTDAIVIGHVPSPASVEIAILDHGLLIGEIPAMPVPDGSSFLYMASVGGVLPEVSQGYELRVTQGAGTISMTIPILTSLAYPQTDILSGTAPANAALLAYLFPYAAPGDVVTQTAVAAGDGAYQLVWAPAVDLRPADSGYLLYAQDASRQTYIRFVAPFLRVQVGGSDLFGAAAPNQEVDIVVEDAAGAALFHYWTYTGSNGFFYAGYCNGYPYYTFSPSNRVIAVAGGQTFSMTVITVTARANLQAGQVEGQALARQPVEVLRFAGPLREWGSCIFQEQPLNRVVVTAAADGGYAAPLPLTAGNYGAALVTLPEGDQVYTRFAVPYLHANLGKLTGYNYNENRIWGQVDEPSVSITVEVQGPSGYLKDWYIIWASSSGYFSDYKYPGDSLVLESGDRITLTVPHRPPLSLSLPVLTAAADPLTDIVSGQAPPYSQVVVTIDFGLQLTVTADAEGWFLADFSALGGFGGGAPGVVIWISPEGYAAARNFFASPEPGCGCSPQVSAAQVGGNEVYFEGGNMCASFTFRLRGADGKVKFENTYNWSPYYLDLHDANGKPILILPGDQIETEGQPGPTPPTFPPPKVLVPTPTQFPTPTGIPACKSQLESDANQPADITLVPTLTLNLDPQTDQAFGQAPPLTVIELDTEGEYLLLTTTATVQGIYTFNLAGVVDLDAGASMRAALRGSPYYTVGVIPVLNTMLYYPGMWGRLLPLTPYTITLSSPLTVTAPITGYADRSGYYNGLPYPAPGGFFGDPGDRVQVETPTRFWDMVLPWLTAGVNASNGVVSGQAPPASRLKIDLSTSDAYNSSTVVTATASGTYSATFPIPGEPLYISGSVTHFTAYDMRASLQFTTPSWFVSLGSGAVSGYAPANGGPITFTLQSYDGAFSQVITGTLYQYGFWIEFERAIHPGDRLTMETPGGSVNEYTVPVLTAVHDFARRVLEGQSPVDGELTAFIPADFYGYGSARRHVRVASNGHFGVDTSDLYPPVGGQGYILYTDRRGNSVMCPFTIRGYPLYLPAIRLSAPFP